MIRIRSLPLKNTVRLKTHTGKRPSKWDNKIQIHHLPSPQNSYDYKASQ
jgi:hypothetical protein